MKKTIFLMSISLMVGSMVFQSCKREGCTNSKAINYDEKAKTDDGSCMIYGCTDSQASNYDYEANIDDNSCIIYGCTDPSASNYDYEATNDDGSCIIYGCTDPGATNYNSNATHDDGSCTYASSTGEGIFWTDADYSTGNILVYVGGTYEGQITQYYYSGIPDCGSSGCVTIERDPGTYSFYATCSTSSTWSGYITITSGGCKSMRLYVSKSGETKSSTGIDGDYDINGNPEMKILKN